MNLQWLREIPYISKGTHRKSTQKKQHAKRCSNAPQANIIPQFPSAMQGDLSLSSSSCAPPHQSPLLAWEIRAGSLAPHVARAHSAPSSQALHCASRTPPALCPAPFSEACLSLAEFSLSPCLAGRCNTPQGNPALCLLSCSLHFCPGSNLCLQSLLLHASCLHLASLIHEAKLCSDRHVKPGSFGLCGLYICIELFGRVCTLSRGMAVPACSHAHPGTP